MLWNLSCDSFVKTFIWLFKWEKFGICLKNVTLNIKNDCFKMFINF